MNDLKLDSDWELVIENHDLATVSGIDAIEQNLGQRLKTFLGEYFLDSRIGLPYFQEIFKKKFDPIVVDTVIKREIINTDGIIELMQFKLELETVSRELFVDFDVLTTNGVLAFSLTL